MSLITAAASQIVGASGGVTAAPTISQGLSGGIVRWRVLNNDASTTEILADQQTYPPTTDRGDISSSAYTSWVLTGFTLAQIQAAGGMTIYATAQASGKSISTVAALYIG